MTLFSTLLLFVAVISFVAGAIILTPLGIVILAFTIYSWKELYPILLRIGRWSSQLRNFLPILFIAIVLGLFILVIGVLLYGTLGFSSLSILLFIWFFFLWLFLFGLAALPILLAIAIWVVEGAQWLFPRYQWLFWQAIPLIDEGGKSAVSKSSKVQSSIASKDTEGSKRGKKTKNGVAPAKEKPGARGNSLSGDAESRQKPSEVLKPDKKPEDGFSSIQEKSGSGDTTSEGDVDTRQKPSKIVIQDKKYKKSTAVQKKPKGGGNSILGYPGRMVFGVLSILGIIEREESQISEKSKVQADGASKDAGVSKQVKKKKKKKKSIAPKKEKP